VDTIDFDDAFRTLTGSPPFPWQRALYGRFLTGDIPSSCNLPTGLGRTAVIPIWLLALANDPAVVPRRLVYVVNRRTVVDQATREAEKVRGRLTGVLAERLRGLSAVPTDPPLAISTLRG
jgi:CRISPR-associated endonuclease/helicase Cas3